MRNTVANGSSSPSADLPGAEHFLTQGGVATDKSIPSNYVLISSALLHRWPCSSTTRS